MRITGPNALYVLIDKRHTILERNQLRATSVEHGAGVPLETIWLTREAARHQRRRIRENMTPEAWATWQFRVVKYRRDT